MRIATFGEIMLRLTCPRGERLLQKSVLRRSWAGSEANVAVALAKFGLESVFVTVLPSCDMGESCIRDIRAHGVDGRAIGRGPGRMGLIFVEPGALMRPSRVVYDRQHSAFSEAPSDSYQWPAILEGTGWFHVSGITPALSRSAREASGDGVNEARRRGIPVSVDLNYRHNLWDSPREAREAMTRLLPHVDYLLGNEEDLATMVTGEDVILEDTVEAQVERFSHTADKVSRLYPNIRKVYSSIRISMSAEENHWAGACYEGGDTHVSSTYELRATVDRIGAGDAFAAGVIYSEMKRMDLANGLEFAVAAGALKHSINGDYLLAGVDEVYTAAQCDVRHSRIRR